MNEERLDDYLDDVYPIYKMGDNTFYPSQILKNCDPTLYRIMLSEMEEDE